MNLPVEFQNRHPATIQVFRFFAYDHLDEPLRSFSAYIYTVAADIVMRLPDGPELTVGLRKLLEARDCFVRCALDLPVAKANPVSPQETSTKDQSELDSALSKKDTTEH